MIANLLIILAFLVGYVAFIVCAARYGVQYVVFGSLAMVVIGVWLGF